MMPDHIKLNSHELKYVSRSPSSHEHRSLNKHSSAQLESQNHVIRVGQNKLQTPVRSRENSVTRHSTPLRAYIASKDGEMHRSASDYNQSKKDDSGSVASQQEGYTGSKFGMRVRQNIAIHEATEKSSAHNYQAYNGDPRMSIDNQDRLIEMTSEVRELLNFKNWVSLQMSKFNDRLTKHENKVKVIDSQFRKENKQNGSFTPEQTQELNKILAIVEKAGNRQEHKRNSKMIQELRENILEVHGKLSQLSSKKDNFSLSIIPQQCNHQKQIKDIKEQIDRAIKKTEESGLINEKISSMEKMLEPLKHSFLYRDNLIGKTISKKKFQGTAKAIVHEQKVTVSSGLPPKPHIFSHPKYSESDASQTITIAIHTYYIDPDGYLLDEYQYYLLDSKEKQICLTQNELKILKEHGLL